MKTTLSERLREAMVGPPKVTGVQLAAACGVAPPSVSAWRTGDSKTLSASNLLAAAKRLGVRPEWLADGIGPKHMHDAVAPLQHMIRENSRDHEYLWPFKRINPQQWSLLDDEQKSDIEKYVALQVKTKAPAPKHREPAHKAAKVGST